MGLLKYADGTTYEGEFLNDLPSGYGKKTYLDGSFYVGLFSMGLFNGQG